MDDVKHYFQTDIIPSERNKSYLERFHKLPHHKLLFVPQFVLAVIGSAGSGKSSFVYTLINKYYKTYFDFLVIISATVDSHDVWNSLNTKKRKVIVMQSCSESKLQKFLKELESLQEERKKNKQQMLNVLLFLDDCSAKGYVSKYRPTTILDILNNRRHWNLNLIMSFQSYTQSNQDFRVHQLTQLIVMQVNKKDLGKIADEHSGYAQPDEIIEFYKMCKRENSYNPFIIDYRQNPSKRYRCGFTKFFKTEDITDVKTVQGKIEDFTKDGN